MKHCGTQTIETKRILLRRFSEDDAEAMFQNWASDPDVTQFLTWPPHTSIKVSQEILEDWVAAYEKDNYYHWAIVLKERGNDPIGGICAINQKDNLSIIHIGDCLGKAWWHQGIMSETLQAVIDYFFDRVGANRIECRHDPRNSNSGMVMKKCGMQYEGTMRESDRNNQGVCDASWYAILQSDRQLLF